MILFELQCGEGHRFEGWFRDGAAYEQQAAEGSIECPLCGDARICKAPMAPHIARSSAAAAQPDPEAREFSGKFLERLKRMRRHVEETCEYVGAEFPEEARRIHYGEVGGRGIYGEASDDQARDLEGEGIEVFRIPWMRRGDH